MSMFLHFLQCSPHGEILPMLVEGWSGRREGGSGREEGVGGREEGVGGRREGREEGVGRREKGMEVRWVAIHSLT